MTSTSSKCDFLKTVFENSCLNNAIFAVSRFQTTTFVSCRMHTMTFDESILRDTVMRECQVLRTSFVKCLIDSSELRHGRFSFNDLSSSKISNIRFVMCDTVDNKKTDTVFKNAETIKSMATAVVGRFSRDCGTIASYVYSVSFLTKNKGVLRTGDHVAINGALRFDVPADVIDRTVSIVVTATSSSWFTLPFSRSPESVAVTTIAIGPDVFAPHPLGGYRRLKRIRRQRCHSL